MNQGGKILLAGDVNKALADIGDIPKADCEIRTNMLDAINAAAKGEFATIALAMPTTPGKLSSILKAIRENCKARIVLLARMPQEPKAAELIASGLADDYFICPTAFSDITSRASDPGRSKSTFSPATLDRINQLERLATEDDLTGLKNRKYVWEFARQVISRASKVGGQVTLLVFDIDNLKHYNDLYGHLAGDSILRQAAVLIRRCCRTHDVVGRIGGDEFAVIFWDDPKREKTMTNDERRSMQAGHPNEAICIAKRFVSELKKAELNLLGPDGKGVLAISGGLSSYPRDGATIGELFEQADRALLDAKRGGKSRIYLVGKSPGDIADIE